MKNAIKVGTLFGIEIRLDHSWFIVFVLLTWSLGAGHFGMYGWGTFTAWTIGILASLLFFASILTHELGHSFVAVRRNVPVRSITLFIFGGLAQIAKDPDLPFDEFAIAIAGPFVSAALGFLYLAIARILADANTPLAALGEWLGMVNLSLALFNLIPGFPLDGGRILRAIVWGWTGKYQTATQIASFAGRVTALAFIFTGVAFFFTGSVVQGIWIALIGWFLNNAAIASYRQVALQSELDGVKAGDIIAHCPFVCGELSLNDLVHDYLLKNAKRCFIVVDEGQDLGIVTLRHVKAYSPGQWQFVSCGKAMTPFERMKIVDAEMPLFDVTRLMSTENLTEVPVFENGRYVGMILSERLLQFIGVRAELEDAVRRAA